MALGPHLCQIPWPMDLRFTDEQDRFRQEIRQWLEAHVPSERFGRSALASLDTAIGFEQHRAWERMLFEARLSVVSWPEEYGGRDSDLWEWLIFEEEYYRAEAPTRVGQNGIFLLAPTMFEFGTDDQKARFLPPMASGEEIWCQGWSEPDSGSDLASLRSTARPVDGGGWRLNGQKTWCSRGAFADWLFGIFRSDPESERHRGLTYFVVKLDTPGVTVRPIAQLDGETGFAEVYFEDVLVPDEQVLGGVNEGWSVAMSTAGSERGMSLRSPARYTEAASRLVALYEDLMSGSGGDAGILRAERAVEEVARAWSAAELYRIHTYWTASRIKKGGSVGADASIGKIHWSETDIAIQSAALELLGETGWNLDSELRPGRWLDGYLFSLAGPIYAGTNEIQRNVIAERLLGMPRG
ncbi:MAG: acyl-CoA dehydrogenase family protein [Acidimicrobiales bacterium]